MLPNYAALTLIDIIILFIILFILLIVYLKASCIFVLIILQLWLCYVESGVTNTS